MEIISILAIIVTPLVAVVVGQWLQLWAKRREDKMNVFKALMTSRIYGWTYDSVHALNMIDVIFADSKKVREQWAKYYRCLNVTPETFNAKEAQQEHWKLLESISEDFGYKGKITWETIQNPYLPKGLSEYMEKQSIVADGQVTLAKKMSSLTGESMPPKPKGTEFEFDDGENRDDK